MNMTNEVLQWVQVVSIFMGDLWVLELVKYMTIALDMKDCVSYDWWKVSYELDRTISNK